MHRGQRGARVPERSARDRGAGANPCGAARGGPALFGTRPRRPREHHRVRRAVQARPHPPRSVDQQRGRHGLAREQNGAGFRASNRGQSPRPLCPRDAADRCLSSTPEARVVTVSSLAHRQGKISFDDLHWQKRGYSASFAYGQSKLANLLFTQELQRRFDEAGVKVRAVAAHPGWTVTNLQQHSFLFRMLPHPTRRTAATTAPTAFSSCVATRRKRRNPRRPRTLRTLPACGKSRSNSRVLNSQSAKPHRAWRANDGALVRP